MSDTKNESEDIETAQKNQKKIGAAENDPETSGPAENLREEAADMVDEEEDSSEPAWSLLFLNNHIIFLFLYTSASVIKFSTATYLLINIHDRYLVNSN